MNTMNNCCSDVVDIDCYPNFLASPIVSRTPTDSLGKTKSEYINQNFK